MASFRKLWSRWVYISVVIIDSCPSISCMARRFAPPSIKCVAKLCLKVCGEIDFLKSILLARSFIMMNIITRVSCFPLLLRKMKFSWPDLIKRFERIFSSYDLISISTLLLKGTSLSLFPFPNTRTNPSL